MFHLVVLSAGLSLLATSHDGSSVTQLWSVGSCRRRLSTCLRTFSTITRTSGGSLVQNNSTVSVHCNSNSTSNWKQSHSTTAQAPTTLSPTPLANWLGTQHWNGGLGVYVTTSTSSENHMDDVVQHMAFRSSGAILVLGSKELEWPCSATCSTTTAITWLEIPFSLQASPSRSEASLKALGYSRRLRMHHVLLQQMKDIAVMWRGGGLLRRQ